MVWNDTIGGGVYGDPDRVRALAREAAAQAERLRDEATRVAGLAEVGWQSSGADRWRDRLDDLVQQLRADADRADEAAAALRHHADEAESTIAAIQGAMAAFERRVADARRIVGDAAEDVADAAVDGARHVLDLARRAPSALSLDWLRFP